MTAIPRALAPTLLALASLAGCASVPFDYPRASSETIDPATETRLKVVVDNWQVDNAGPSGFYPLTDGTSALGARLRLIEAADKSIDAQYFLMKNDTAGKVFAAALLRAADRGVRVRFLLDDVFTTVKDEGLELLNGHPNIEVRLFNPVARRGIRGINFLTDFRRANRRMHNKSLTVDGQATIVGGRNIADEYFELRPEGEFLDLDVLAIGPVANEVGQTFDLFWNDRRSVPVDALSSKFSPTELEEARARALTTLDGIHESVYAAAANTQLLHGVLSGATPMLSAAAEVITDDPEKLRSAISPEQQVLVMRLAEVVSAAESEVVVLTPYNVPGKSGIEFWREVAARGVRVIMITNSLASNNHTAVHSGYAKYRHRLLEAGVELYEARADAVTQTSDGVQAESMTLHTKSMIIDRRFVFIGSLNLDPRSIDINSEMGMLIDSPELAAGMAAGYLPALDTRAYRVQEDERGRLTWSATIDGERVTETSEPLAGWWRRFQAFVLRLAPESQL